MTLYCPYCNCENEDPEIESLEEDEIDYTTCKECEKNFSYYYHISFSFHGDKIEEDLERSKRKINSLNERLATYKSRANDTNDKVKIEQLGYDVKYTQELIERKRRELEDIEDRIEDNILTLTKKTIGKL